jgi:hypothetical protein
MWTAGISGASAQAYDASGTWASDWGPVNLTLSGPQPDRTYNVSGYWQQRGQKGVIQRGNYDPSTGNLWFAYFEPWNNRSGSAKFRMNNSGTKLRGTWKQQSGNGSWTLSRQVAPLLPGQASTPPVGSPAASRGSANITGVWRSEWGPVTFRQGTPQMDGSYLVSGSWAQGPGQVGVIQHGRVMGNVVVFKYTMPWVATSGSARLILSPDRRKLSGTWTQKDGSGPWTMTR